MNTSMEPRLAGIGLRVDMQSTAPGIMHWTALPDHRIKVQTAREVRGTCGAMRFHYRRGDIDIFPAGLSDIWQEDNASTSLLLRVAPALLHRAAEELGLPRDRAGLEPRHQLRDSRIEHIAWALDAERRDGYSSGLLYAESLGMALAVHLLGRYGAPARVKGGLSKAQLRRILSFVEDQLDRDLSLTQLASIVGLSSTHLKTLFRRSMGMPVHQYVIQRRVERAKSLLLDGKLPASQVALEAGFAHQSHMARSMRRVLGVTPKLLAREAAAG
jgi:AraC family transcriptional regulator